KFSPPPLPPCSLFPPQALRSGAVALLVFLAGAAEAGLVASDLGGGFGWRGAWRTCVFIASQCGRPSLTPSLSLERRGFRVRETLRISSLNHRTLKFRFFRLCATKN